MNRFKAIPVDIYRATIYFIHSDLNTMQLAHSKLFDGELPYISDRCEGGCFGVKLGSKNPTAIWVTDEKHLVHEIIHAVFFLLEDAGMVLSLETSEAYAYLSGYLYKKCKECYE